MRSSRAAPPGALPNVPSRRSMLATFFRSGPRPHLQNVSLSYGCSKASLQAMSRAVHGLTVRPGVDPMARTAPLLDAMRRREVRCLWTAAIAPPSFWARARNGLGSHREIWKVARTRPSSPSGSRSRRWKKPSHGDQRWDFDAHRSPDRMLQPEL